MLTLTMG